MQEKIKQFQDTCIPELHKLLADLVAIPAPSNHEEQRAAFCKEWLEMQGAEGVTIDEALNCICPINCDGRDDIVVFAAHTDTVFPDTTPFELKNDGEKFYAPGVGDDTASLAVLLMVTKFIIQNKLKPNCGILVVANSGEEGLGNLKGTRKLMEEYKGRIKEFYTLDARYVNVYSRCVGSHRYEVECATQGGHSFAAFGRPNAIAELAELIADLYRVEVPVKENCKTTYNVGAIEGGTSVNTIAQNAKMLYEYRSDDAECLAIMQKNFEDAIERAKARGKATFTVKSVGIRPCDGDVDRDVHNRMIENAIAICEKHTGLPCTPRSASTDCNIPMSMGIPSLCLGVYEGGGAHTREEYVVIDSLPTGLKICFDLMLGYFNY